MPQFKKMGVFQDKEEGASLNSARQSTLITERETALMPATSALKAGSLNSAQQSASITEQETAPVPAISTLTGPSSGLPDFAQSFFGTILSRAREPKPERWSRTWQQMTAMSQSQVLGWFPMLLVIDALGILMITLACVYSLRTFTDQQAVLWIGLFVIFAASFLRMLSPFASRVERILVLCSTSLFIYLVSEIRSPLHFVFVDEYTHWRTVNDIVRTHHLFSANSMLPVSPLYPGLEIVTDAFSSLSGLDTFVSGLIVTGVARLVITLSLFMLVEQITKSARTAGIATMLYMCNSGFFTFDSFFVYEALGLAIGIFLLFVVAHMDTAKSGKHALLLIACLAIGALTTVHHVSDFFFVGLLLLWTMVSKLLRQPLLRVPVAIIAFCGLLLAVLWVTLIAKPVVGYLFSPVVDSLNQLKAILLGISAARHPFTDYTGNHPTALWQQLVMLLALALTTLGVPFAVLCLWYRYRRKALPFMLGLVSLLYPLLQSLRLTSESANIAGRSAPFIFIAVSFALAIFITQMWPTYKLRRRQALLITMLASVVFLGGAMLGSGPSWELMPGTYLVGDDARSINPESIQMASWILSHFGPNNRVYADSTNVLLLNSYGEQRIVTIPYDRVDIAPVYYATQYHEWERSILQAAHVRYLIVDLRLSTVLPVKGYYFEGHQEPDINVTTPMSAEALKKFDSIDGFQRIFDSGNIVIYDVGGLTNAPQTP